MSDSETKSPKTLSDFYAANLDETLATFGSDAARLVYLAGQSIIWGRRYARFIETGIPHATHPDFGPPSEFAYSNVIAIIEGQQAKYAEAVPA